MIVYWTTRHIVIKSLWKLSQTFWTEQSVRTVAWPYFFSCFWLDTNCENTLFVHQIFWVYPHWIQLSIRVYFYLIALVLHRLPSLNGFSAWLNNSVGNLCGIYYDVYYGGITKTSSATSHGFPLRQVPLLVSYCFCIKTYFASPEVVIFPFLRAIVNSLPHHFLSFPLAGGSSDLHLQLSFSNCLGP